MALLLEKAKWAVLSFRPVTDNEAGLAEAVQATGGRARRSVPLFYRDLSLG
jgi:hypothetical protein